MIGAIAIIDRAGDSLGESLPRIGGALLLLVLGLLAAWILGRVTARALLALEVDTLAERLGVHDVIERVGIERSLSRLLGRIVRIVLTIIVLIAVVTSLGLGALSESLNEAVLFLPKLIVALALVLIGVIAADFVRDWVDRLTEQMDVGISMGRVAQAIVFAAFLLTAAAQLGIPTEILTGIVGLVAVAAALTVALAFGLGSRDVARQLSAGRYVASSFEVGQRISVGDVTGEIIALDTASAVLRTTEGQTVRVPNHLLLESIVAVD